MHPASPHVPFSSAECSLIPDLCLDLADGFGCGLLHACVLVLRECFELRDCLLPSVAHFSQGDTDPDDYIGFFIIQGVDQVPDV